MTPNKPRPYALMLLLLLFGVTLLRAWFAACTELSPDEAYYWTWSEQLDLGYYDHPPMVAYLIRMGTLLLGPTHLGVRLGALLCGFWVGWMLFVLTRRFTGSARQGFWVALLGTFSPMLAVGSVIHTTDMPLCAAWVSALWFGLRVLERDRLLDWAGLGMCMGLAALCKGIGLALLPCLFVFLLSCQMGRSRLTGIGPALTVLLALAIFLPNWFWNSRHGGGSVGFQLHHGFSGMSLSLPRFFEFFGGQAGMASPLLWIGPVLFVIAGFRRRVRNARPEAFFLWCFSAPVLVGFALLAALNKVEANWPAAGYLAALPGAAWALTGGFWFVRRLSAWVTAAWTVAALFTLMIHLQAAFSLLPLDPEKDPTRRLQGWRELAAQATADAQALDASLAAEGYGLVSELRFYSHLPVLYQPAPYRLSQYDLWPQAKPGRVLLLQPNNSPDPPRLCQKAQERWQLIKEPSAAYSRAWQYRWWVCEGFPNDGGQDAKESGSARGP